MFFAAALYWTADVMANFGGMPWIVAHLLGALLWAALALAVALTAVLIGAAVRRFGLAGVWLTPIFWVTTEWIRGWIGGGFPWTPLGNSQVTVLPIAQLASVTGVYGVSFLVALVGTAAAVVALTRRRVHLAGAAGVVALLVVVAAAGAWRLSDNRLVGEGEPLRVGLVQGNVEQLQKWDPRFRDAIIERYINLSRNVILGGAKLVVWPEASTPFYLGRDGALAAPIRDLAAQSHVPFIIGTDEFDGKQIYNTAGVIGADGRSRGSYRKIHLVPFGEYVPMKKLLFFVGPLVEAVSDFSAGTEAVVLDTGTGVRCGVSICYESTFPGLSRTFANTGAQLLLVITNDGWFGQSSAAYQHYEMGRMRAIETGRYLARAANTGISAVVDPYGREIARAEMFEPLALTADVRLLQDRTVYSRIGDLVAWMSAAMTALFVGATRLRA